MMTFILLVVAELFFGMMVGFILSDNKKGLSIEEIKISSILFLISAAIVFWQNPQLTGIVFTQLALSWFMLTVGVLLGEMLKMRLISNIVRTIQKKDIQLAINELVQFASQTQHTGDLDSLHKKLYEVQDMLRGLAKKSEGIQSTSFLNKLRYLFELCEDYVSLSVKLQRDIKAGKQSTDMTGNWLAIGQELTGLSWDTLNHAEENVKNELGKAFSMKVVHRAVVRR